MIRRKFYSLFLLTFLCLSIVYLLRITKKKSDLRLRLRSRTSPLREPNPLASKRDQSLAIVEVLGGTNVRADYQTAIDSVECYAIQRGHAFFLITLEDFQIECGHHKDFFYRRHCAIHYLMESINYEWVVFLDSDMEIVTENRTFFEFLTPDHDVYLYDRYWNWENKAGSYIVRNNQFGRHFVKYFADYEFLHPKAKHDGTDNGAIQAVVADIFFGDRGRVAECWKIWQNSTNWDDMFSHEWCIRKKLGARADLGRIRIYPKGLQWARDGGLTSGKFSPERDFVLHGRKEYSRKPFDPNNLNYYWYDTREIPLNVETCRFGNDRWKYRPELLLTAEEHQKNLNGSASGTRSFLDAVHQRLNLTEEFEEDKKTYGDVVTWLSSYHTKL